MFLYPINSAHTRPMVCGVARSTARNHARSDSKSKVNVTPVSVISEAERAFKGFCRGHEANGLTNNYMALQAMYMSAYITEYHLTVKRTRVITFLWSVLGRCAQVVK